MRKILIVEDEKFIRDLYILVFTRAGYDVDVAVDGEEAVNTVRSNVSFDIILLDIMLPKMNGMDVLKIIRDKNAPSVKTPVFLISNLGQDDIMKEAFSLGADGYLLKAQLTPTDVVAAVESFFANHSYASPVSCQ
jgi:two-component system, OmpR family, alkaline phosphatase synthesis response regulator PhoP